MRLKGVLSIIALFIVIVLLVLSSLFGIGENNVFSVTHINQGLDLMGGAYIVYEAEKESPTEDEMNSALALIRERLDRKGYAEAEVAREGSKRLRVEIPGVENADEAIAEIGQTAQLRFVSPEGIEILNGADVKNAAKQVGSDPATGQQQIYVNLEFNDEGTRKFAEATTQYVNQIITIELDGNIQSAPVVQSPILNGNARITGNFTSVEAEELAALIRAGALPFNLIVLESNNIGARLGANALETSIFAGVVAFILIFLFMLFVYTVSGLAANLALVIFVALELIILSVFNITLTLPGIAGIILSVGMAVDANIIIFERIKEELRGGKTLRASIHSGFQRAFPAILDGNVTTLIAALILYWLGTGPIKGFSQTLTIGILLSMFTAIVITRFILKSLVWAGINNPKFYGLKVKQGGVKK